MRVAALEQEAAASGRDGRVEASKPKDFPNFDIEISQPGLFDAAMRDTVVLIRCRRGLMKNNAIRSMSTEELWSLYEQVSSTLARKVTEEKARLEERLRRVQAAGNVVTLDRARRPYPKVLPKYQNPHNDAETWSGRGKQPRWLAAQLRSGKSLNSFLIARSAEKRRQAG